MPDNSLIRKTEIKRVIRETKDSRTFVLHFPEGEKPVYQAGQFITLVFYTPHGEKRRSYSISSAPGIDDDICITVKKVDNGEFSRYLVYHAKEGDILYTSGIGGFFTLPRKEEEEEAEQYFFLAAGSGITPCFSMLKTVLAFTGKPVTLVYSNKSEADTIFYSQLKELQEKYGERLEIRFLFSDNFSIYHKRLSKWLLEQLLPQSLKTGIHQVFFYLCGPFDYMQTIRITLLGKSVPAHHIIRENFNTLPPVKISRPPDTQPHKVIVHISGKQHELLVQYPQTILAAAKAKNIELPYSCEAGRCGSCAATCTSGKVWIAYNEVLMDSEMAKGRILTCQGFPVGGDAEIVI